MFPSLVTLDGFYAWLSTHLTADLPPEWNSWSMFHQLSHIYAKTPFCCVEAVANNALNRRRVVIFDQMWANAAPTWKTVFSPNSIYNRPKWILWSFLMFSGTTAEFGRTERSASFLSLRPRLISIAPLNRCFWRSRVRIILIQPLLCLIIIFPIKKQCLINTWNCFENLPQLLHLEYCNL